MDKTELIQLLKDYKENKAKLNIKLKELENARIALNKIDIETSMTSSYGENQDIHSKNKISDKVLRKIEENDSKRIEKQKEIEKLEEEVRELRQKVEAVDDRLEGLKYKERELLYAYYVEGRTAEDVGNNLYLRLFSQTRSGRQIQDIIKKAVDKIVRL